ncbi:MAG: EF-P lysine aminoacylase GenX [Candidatus Magasanikbacteria bacterium CG10_big_fil_rev_8_21_14_0_10_47_10]|uniref:EF-P lysine aminoacylase GenX n=1 Tax=Candidatus Magasanikbacteria bacterium CG10_big_fil_rev_8_21_14_0_10_47_10 TaxID=1974652 RepID=A0A2H0TP45_9BACT|nr:MAG: EF-P lysine aminoacylase GenX [Candidatus Magasanikbacteria bacterium CG10_big_fil_rev_8_21_14_0_10_47_10]
MSPIHHIAKNKALLDLRWQILRSIRVFFWEQGFQEVETPMLTKLPGQEPNISPMGVTIHNEKGTKYSAFLHTSPEYSLKKMLAAGYDKIFSLSKVFRDGESFGGHHNPEFTMIEWYRAGTDMFALMDDVEDLLVSLRSNPMFDGNCHFNALGSTSGNDEVKRIHMRELWQQTLGINLDDYLTDNAMRELCIRMGYAPAENEPYEALFYRIFLNHIEPLLQKMGTVIVHHYPSHMAALSKISSSEPGYAERFELYIHGIEIANAFSELTDADEQLTRLVHEQKERAAVGLPVYDIDREFIEAVGHMPQAAGIALGVDRLIMALLDIQNINDILPFSASILWPSVGGQGDEPLV